MSVAHELLHDLTGLGATIEKVGDRLVLKAGATAIPAALVGRVRKAKRELIAVLPERPLRGLVPGGNENAARKPSDIHRDQAFDRLVVQWLNEHPASSMPGRCAWCRRTEAPGATVLPFGTEPGTHTWLHAECWAEWHTGRRAKASAALESMGMGPRSQQINEPNCCDADR